MGFVRWNELLGWPTTPIVKGVLITTSIPTPIHHICHFFPRVNFWAKIFPLTKSTSAASSTNIRYTQPNTHHNSYPHLICEDLSSSQDVNPQVLKMIISTLSILLMSSQDSVQKLGQNAARNDLLILQTSLRIFLAPGIGSVQYTYWLRG